MNKPLGGIIQMTECTPQGDNVVGGIQEDATGNGGRRHAFHDAGRSITVAYALVQHVHCGWMTRGSQS